MAAELDLKDRERRVYTSFFQDGLHDVALGLVVLLTGVCALVSPREAPSAWRFAIYLLMLTMPALVILLGKRRITVPRLGHVRFGAERRARQARTRVALAAVVLLTLALMVLTILARKLWLDALAWVRGHGIEFAPGAVVLAGLGLTAFLMDFPRLYLHAVLFAAAITVAEVSGSPAGFFASSALAMVIGLGLLARFVLTHPVLQQEGADGR